jgi:hypothetical protein
MYPYGHIRLRAYTYPDACDLMKTYARLKAAGIMPYWPVHHGIALSLYKRIPTGTGWNFRSIAARSKKPMPSRQAKRSALIRSASAMIPTGCSNNMKAALGWKFFYGAPKALPPVSHQNMA